MLSLYLSPANTYREWMYQKMRHYTTGRYYKTSHKILLGLYSLIIFYFIRYLLSAYYIFHWKIVLMVFGIRLLVQVIIFYRTMRKLNEKDLFLWFIFFDIGMFFYYLVFSFSLFKKPSNNWK